MWVRNAIAAILLGTISTVIIASPVKASSTCTDSSWYVGGCPNIGGELGDDEALLVGDLNGPGSESSGGGGGSGNGRPDVSGGA